MHKYIILLLVLIVTTSAYAQVKLPPKQTQTQPKATTEKNTKKEEKEVYKGLVFTLKVTSNAASKLYVDGEYKGIANNDQILRVDLKKGEYQIRAVSIDNDADVFQELYTVEQVSAEKFYEIDMQVKINARLAKEEADAEAKRLAQKLEEEKRNREEQDARDKQEREVQYNAAMAKANELYLDKNYTEAEPQYKKALELKSSSSDAKTGMENINYQKALKYDNEEFYSYYINNYPTGTYINDVKQRYEKRKEENAYQRAKTSNNMDDWESYVNKYPYGKYAPETKKLIENRYYSFGVESYNNKKYADAQSQLGTYLSRYPSGSHAAEARDLKNKADRKIKALNRPNKLFLDYAFDTHAFIGLGIGSYNQRKMGMYFATRMNKDLFTSTAEYKTDNNFTHDGSIYDIVIPTGLSRSGKIDGILGVTYGVINPLWVYMGIGMGYYPTFYQFNEYPSSGGAPDIAWARNVDQTTFPFLHEMGVAVSLGPLNVSTGICIRSYSEVFMEFKAGFSITR